jgi:glucokinase
MFDAMAILVGDIGGTKTDLAICDGGGAITDRRRFASRSYPSLEAVVAEFLADRRVQAAAFAVAGPVFGGRCKATNLPWSMDEVTLSELLGAPASLLNDFAAAALGVPALAQDDLVVLNAGSRDPDGPMALLGAGTGLGEAIALPTALGLRVLSSEGGHVDFAPRDELEIDLLRFLQRRHHGRVSVERIVSGPGLVAVYEFVIAHGIARSTPETEAELLAGRDAAEVIGRRGYQGEDPACDRALTVFMSLYGSEAGNLALKVLPTGGVYIVGGMAPKLIDRFKHGEFMQSMLHKGRMSDVLAKIPVAIVISADVTLLGARARANMVYRDY